MKCLYCNGEMEKVKSSYTINRDGYHLFIKEVPMYVCTRCNEKHIEEKEVSVIQNMIEHLEDDIQKVQTMA